LKKNGLDIFTLYQVFESLLMGFGNLFKSKWGAIYVKTVLSNIKVYMTAKFTTPITVDPKIHRCWK